MWKSSALVRNAIIISKTSKKIAGKFAGMVLKSKDAKM
jgi:hypothetical protein